MTGDAHLDRFLAGGGDVNDVGFRDGLAPLHWMLDWQPTHEPVKWLLAHGADPKLRCGPLAETALHVAARRYRPWAIEMLLDRGAEIDARMRGGSTAYQHARRRGFTEVAERLAARGADIALEPADVLAVRLIANDLDTARAMIDVDPALVPALTPDRARILPDLAGRPMVEAVTLLLDAGADITWRGLDDGMALHQAAWFGQPAVAELLIERGAPIDAGGDAHHSTPLGWVAHGSRYSDDAEARADAYARIATLLLEAGASLAHPSEPERDARGRWLLRDAGPAVAAVLERFGAKR